MQTFLASWSFCRTGSFFLLACSFHVELPLQSFLSFSHFFPLVSTSPTISCLGKEDVKLCIDPIHDHGRQLKVQLLSANIEEPSVGEECRCYGWNQNKTTSINGHVTEDVLCLGHCAFEFRIACGTYGCLLHLCLAMCYHVSAIFCPCFTNAKLKINRFPQENPEALGQRS